MDTDCYHQIRCSMYQADPRLKETKLDGTLTDSEWLPWQNASPRVVAMHLGRDDSFGPPTQYNDSTSLQHHLQQSSHVGELPQRSVYILEALSRDFAAVLGCHFKLHPSLFMDHERFAFISKRATGEAGGIPILPSSLHGRDHISIKYHEPSLLSTLPTGFRNLCDVSGRHVAVTRVLGRFSEVGTLRRKCTWWSRRRLDGGWDCLIICDPPLRRVLTDYSYKTGYNVTTSPYNTGYVDFMPQKDQLRSRSGPPRTSFLDDVVFYFQTYSNQLDLTDPDSTKVFAEKITASHYLKLAEYLQIVIEVVQFSLSRRPDSTNFAIAAVEEQWSDIQALQRRIGEYKDDLLAIMLQLRIPCKSPVLEPLADWKDGAVDFQYLYSRFTDLGQRAEGLNTSVAALASVISNHQSLKVQEFALEATERSIREAKSMKALTVLGVVFIPLAYVSSVFSMSDPYRPGGGMFWVYLIVAFPLVGLVVLAYYGLDLGYSRAGTEWSVATLMSNIEKKLRK